jgi:ribokinase
LTAKIVVVGSFNMDLVLNVSHLPRPGETVMATHFASGPGGKGSNAAIAAARLGAEVSFVARVGTDVYGTEALRIWQAEGINLDYIVRDDGAATGVAPVLVDAEGENMIAVALNANDRLTTADIDAALPAIEAADVLLTQFEIPQAAAAYALQVARRSRTRTILNPAPAEGVTLDMLVYADVLTPNEIELDALYGDSSLYRHDAAEYLLTSDEQVVIITMGPHGARWIKRDGTAAVGAYTVDVADTTGAGDAFNGALAVALAEGQSLETAIHFANAAGALCTTRPGAGLSMPRRDEVEALLKEMD